MPLTNIPGDVPAKFWAKVEVVGDCWLWTGATTGKGYGHVSIWGIKCPSHRVAYELTTGPIPYGKQLDHLCRNPRCVNPFHLEPVDNRTNSLRGTGCCAINAKKTHCLRGHEFTPETTVIRRSKRYCRLCKRIKSREYKKRKCQ